MTNEKVAEELIAESRSPQSAHEYAIRREKGIERSRTIKSNPFGATSSRTIKQEPMGYMKPCIKGAPGWYPNINPEFGRGHQNFSREISNKQSKGMQTSQGNKTQNYHNCGRQFGSNRLQSCPAKD